MIKDCPDILRKIVETKKVELCELRKFLPDFRKQAGNAPAPLSFKNALTAPGLSVIAEIKKASPSAGIISEQFEPEKIAAAYMKGNAAAVSILTDKQYFKGNIEYIRKLRDLITVPVLRKDFIIDPLQIYEARAYGADTFLLIAAILEKNQLEDMIEEGRSLGMEPLVESHNEYELEKTVEAGAEIIGINNRNLHTFEVDIDLARRIRPMIPETAISVAESGIRSPEDAVKIADAGYNAILVGEALMRSGLEKCPDVIKEMSLGKNPAV